MIFHSCNKALNKYYNFNVGQLINKSSVMQEQELINISVESDIKIAAEEIFKQFGMTKSEAVELFYLQVAKTKDIPFAQRNFNKDTVRAREEVKDKGNLTTYKSFAQLRQDLEV